MSPFLNQINLVHAFLKYLFQDHYNIFHSSIFRSSIWSLIFMSSTITPKEVLFSQCVPYVPPSLPLWSDNPYNTWNFSLISSLSRVPVGRTLLHRQHAFFGNIQCMFPCIQLVLLKRRSSHCRPTSSKQPRKFSARNRTLVLKYWQFLKM